MARIIGKPASRFQRGNVAAPNGKKRDGGIFDFYDMKLSKNSSDLPTI